ncbi:ATP-binding protein [Thioclava sp. FR2]|uniref:ATP-binding protein n=1 Tax=Thioclava sp. FR2 TaxID=3445780 RepID=UPI003EBDA81C
MNPSNILREVVEAMPDGFALYDPDDRLLVCNRAFRQVLEDRFDGPLSGMTFPEIAHLCRRLGVYENVGVDPDAYVETRINAHKKGNSVIIQELKSGRVERIDEIRLESGYTVGIHADVTQLYQENLASKKRETAKSDFLSVMSHEIRTPLVGLVGMLDLLQEAKTKAERSHIHSIMRDASERLMSIVNTVLDLSKIESGQMILESTSFMPEQVLMPLFERYRVAAQKKGVDLNFINELPGKSYQSDPLRFGQIVENLLSNAVKFTEKGSITLILSGTAEGTVKVEVSDTGIGIATSHLPRLLQPFEQADPSHVRKFGGTGLGMSIVNKLTALFGGTFNCSSTIGQGTTFTILLPMTPEDAKRRRVASGHGREDVRFDGLRALMADDNDINRHVLSAFLTGLGLEVVQVEDGMKAVEAARSQAFDVIFLDISMPDLDGVEVLHMIRKRGPNQSVPVLAVTANVLKSEIDKFLAEGFVTVLSKPFTKVDLKAALQRAQLGSAAKQ